MVCYQEPHRFVNGMELETQENVSSTNVCCHLSFHWIIELTCFRFCLGPVWDPLKSFTSLSLFIGGWKSTCSGKASKSIPQRVTLISAWDTYHIHHKRLNSRIFPLICLLFGGGGVVIKSWIRSLDQMLWNGTGNPGKHFFHECLVLFKLPIVGFTCFQFSLDRC